MPDTLNPDQRQAVDFDGRPLLVLASAGTGKTHVLTARFVRLVDKNRIDPERILAVTFTRKAAAELKTRITDALQRPDLDSDNLWIGTFHALSSRILRNHVDLARLPAQNFSVIQPEETRRLAALVIRRATGFEPEPRRVSQFLRQIDTIKNEGADLTDTPANWPSNVRRPMQTDLELIEAYHDELSAIGCLDYGDLIAKTISLLNREPAVLAAWRRRFAAILVDEYQDTNAAQQRWIRLLAGDGHSLACVGDDDQSIHAFRGARMQAVLDFDKTWPLARVITLTENYRCPADIISRTATMMTFNPHRRPKITRASGNRTGSLHALAHDGLKGLIDTIEDVLETRDQTIPLNGVAVLGRTNKACQDIAAMLTQRRVPAYVLSPDAANSPQFLALIAWARLVLNVNDDAAFMTAAQGLATQNILDNLYLGARLKRASLVDYIAELGRQGALSSPTLPRLAADVTAIRSINAHQTPGETIDTILDVSGLARQANALPSAQKTRFWRFYAALMALSGTNVPFAGMLEKAQNEIVDTAELPDAVIISTMHAMKGLQAPLVISPGWNDKEFPMKLRNPDPKELEEERRVAFVTITRASHDAWLLYDSNKGPSIFLRELGLLSENGHTIAA